MEFDLLGRSEGIPLVLHQPMDVFFFRSSKTSRKGVTSTVLLSRSGSLIAAVIFPCITSLAKVLVMSSTDLAFLEDTNFSCINRTSFIKRFRSPCFQRASLHSIAALCSLLFDVLDGFWRIRDESTINALSGIKFSYFTSA